MADSSADADALEHTIAVTRRHPDIWKWARQLGKNIACDEIVWAWRLDPTTQAYIEARYGRKEEDHLLGLLDAAARYIEAEDERLAAAWGLVTSAPEWQALPRSARSLYEVLHAKAAEQGRLGGPRVLMCHTLAIALIDARTGRRYSKGSITSARVALAKRGFIEAQVGEPWTRGVKSKGTVYDLLPADIREQTELCLCARKGIVQLQEHAPRPRLSDEDRELLYATIDELRDGRRQEEQREAEREQCRPAADAELDKLLDYPDEPAVRHVRSGARCQEGGTAVRQQPDTDFDALLGDSGDGEAGDRNRGCEHESRLAGGR